MPETSAGGSSALVQGDRVRGSLYVDPGIFARELEEIWNKTWVYLGHESEFADVGDFKRRTLGRQPVLLLKSSDNQVRVFFNRCRHRANLLCQREAGNARMLRCPYHGWTYGLNGELLAPTFDEAYEANLRKEDFGLTPLPRVASYRGLIFGSAAKEGPSLTEHLGESASFLDLIFDRSPVGQLELTAGIQKMRYKGNWKMLPENSLEGAYHGHFIHKFAFNLFDSRSGRDRMKTAEDSTRYLAGGHMVEDFRHAGLSEPRELPPHRKVYLDALEQIYGRQRAKELAPGRAPILYIFPNLMFVQTHFRWLQPVGVNETFVYAMPALLKGVPPAINEELLRNHETSFGPAGFLSPDDLEIMARTQIALEAGGDDWLFIGRGAHRERSDAMGGSTGHCMDENHLRGFWRHYSDMMSLGS
jgi:fatty-acyl-CoA synthase